MTQNRSHAVMAQRHEVHDSLDFFPTPPWATRALCEHVLRPMDWLGKSVREPACGEGDMARPLSEYFADVTASDIHPYGYGDVLDFLLPFSIDLTDWVITNPPFALAQEFIARSFPRSRIGVAMLVRTVFLDTKERFDGLFRTRPPSIVAKFAERVPMVKGRLDRKATDYCWIVWRHCETDTRMRWIPPCRKTLERYGDYHGDSRK